MQTTAKHLAQRLSTDERTLRRAIRQGSVRASRTSARRIEVSDEEDRYLRDYWALLRSLRGALRTEPNVRLAVVFGSVARGTTHTGSDIDLLVDVRVDDWEHLRGLNSRLERATGHSVDLVVLARARRTNPGLVADVLRDGRTLVDRDDRWWSLRRREHALRREAGERERREAAEAAAALRELIAP